MRFLVILKNTSDSNISFQMTQSHIHLFSTANCVRVTSPSCEIGNLECWRLPDYSTHWNTSSLPPLAKCVCSLPQRCLPTGAAQPPCVWETLQRTSNHTRYQILEMFPITILTGRMSGIITAELPVMNFLCRINAFCSMCNYNAFNAIQTKIQNNCKKLRSVAKLGHTWMQPLIFLPVLFFNMLTS